MSHRYQKGSKRPPAEAHRARRDKGQPKGGYTLSGGVPWPTLGDGTPYVLPGKSQPFRVRHAELEKETGTLQWVEWCHPDGSHMPDLDRHTKARTPKLRPGGWWAVVAWDSRDQHDSITARHPLENLVVENAPSS